MLGLLSSYLIPTSEPGMHNKELYEARLGSLKYWHPLSKIKYPASPMEVLPQDSNRYVKCIMFHG